MEKALVMSEQGLLIDQKSGMPVMDETEANDEVAWLAGRLPERIVPIAAAQPGRGCASKVEPFLKRGFRGMKFHPTQFFTSVDGAEYDPYMELAGRYRVPVQVHCGLSAESAPEKIMALAARHPGVPVVLVHTIIGRGGVTEMPQLERVIDMVSSGLEKGIDLFVDLSGHRAEGYPLAYALERLGPDRLLFGTDGTIDQPRFLRRIPGICGSFREALKRDHGDDVSEKIFRLNAIGLYGPTGESKE